MRITFRITAIFLFLIVAIAQAQGALPSGMEFVTIPSGSFQVGSPSSEQGRGNDEVQCDKSVLSFELMTTEVTQGMWEEIMGNNPALENGVGYNYPVYSVTWKDCQEFIDKLNELDPGHIYRLPSEVEWEYACRAGTTTRFYWGDSASESEMKPYCWYEQNSDDAYWTEPHASSSGAQPVGTREPNGWGLFDMSGNVWEWCQDTYENEYANYPSDGSANPGTIFESMRAKRGGSWGNNTSNVEDCRSANRYNLSAGSRYPDLGFRVARSASL